MKHLLKQSTYFILIVQLLLSPVVAVAESDSVSRFYDSKTDSHLQNQDAVNKSKPLTETGDLFLPELKETDIRLLTTLASGDFLGLKNQTFKTTEESFFRSDPEFGKNLLVMPPSQEQFLKNTKIYIQDGVVHIKEQLDSKKQAFGREHSFFGWHFKGVHVAGDYLFLEVDKTQSKNLPGELFNNFELNKNSNNSVFLIRLTDLLEHMGTKRIIMSVMPLPMPLQKITNVKYQAYDPVSDKNAPYQDKALTGLLSRDFKTSGYKFTDATGGSVVVPSHVPDIYSDMSRLFVKALSASIAPLQPLNSEGLTPVQKNYLKALTSFAKKQNTKHNQVFDTILTGILKKLNPSHLTEVPFSSVLDFVRASYADTITTPKKGSWVGQAYSQLKINPKDLTQAQVDFEQQAKEQVKDYLQAQKNTGGKELKQAGRMMRTLKNPHPNSRDITLALQAKEQIKKARYFSKEKLTQFMKGPLGNVVGVMGITALTLSLYHYTGFGGWADGVGEGFKAQFSSGTEAIKALKVNAVVVIGYLGGLGALLYLGTKLKNKLHKTKQSLVVSLANIAKYKSLFFRHLFSVRGMVNAIFPNYSQSVYRYVVPQKKLGAYDVRFSKSLKQVGKFLNFKSFFVKLLRFNNVKDSGESVVFKTLSKQDKDSSKKIALNKEALVNKRSEELILFEMLPHLAKTLKVSELDLLSAMALKNVSLGSSEFLDWDFKTLSNWAKNSEDQKIKKALIQFKSKKHKIETQYSGLLSKYFLYKNEKRIMKKIKKTKDFQGQRAFLKSLYYLSLKDLRLQGFEDPKRLTIEQAKSIFSDNLEKLKAFVSQESNFDKVAMEQNIIKATRSFQSVYQLLHKEKTSGLKQRQFVAMAKINTDHVTHTLRATSLDYGMERVQSYAEFFKTLQARGISFYDPTSWFTENHTMGLYNQDARHALWNPVAHIISGPLGTANIISRSGPDAVDYGVENTSFFYRNIRQFVNPQRYRQMGIFNKSMWYEYKRNFLRGLIPAFSFSVVLQMTFYHEFRPDIFVGYMFLYGPIGFVWHYIQSKLLMTTQAIKYASIKPKLLKNLEQEQKMANTVTKKWALAMKKYAIKVNPQWFYIVPDLILFNALTFFMERWSYDKGPVQMLSSWLGKTFNQPNWEFSLYELQSKFVTPYLPKWAMGIAASYLAYQLYIKLRDKKAGKNLVNKIVKTSKKSIKVNSVFAGSCKSLFR